MGRENSVEAKPYWDGLAREQLLLQQCGDCGAVRHYPRAICAKCLSFAVVWKQASGRGTVHSWTITHQTPLPDFGGRVPYALVTVDLVEGVRMLAPLVSIPVEELRVGLPVRVLFEKQRDATTIPVFVKITSEEGSA